MWSRMNRLVLTLIAKKYLAWAVACGFLWAGKVTGTDWVLLTGAVFALDLATKVKAPYREPEGKPDGP